MLSWIFLLKGARASFTRIKDMATVSAAALPLGSSGSVGVLGGAAKGDAAAAAGVSIVAAPATAATCDVAVGGFTGSLLVGATVTASCAGGGVGGEGVVVVGVALAPGVVGAVVAPRVAAAASDGTAI